MIVVVDIVGSRMYCDRGYAWIDGWLRGGVETDHPLVWLR